jgi:hypothetical protein
VGTRPPRANDGTGLVVSNLYRLGLAHVDHARP